MAPTRASLGVLVSLSFGMSLLTHAADPALFDTSQATLDAARKPQANRDMQPASVANIEISDIKEAPRAATTLDLTGRPEDLWQRMRHGFSIPNLESTLVADREGWYSTRPQQIKIMVERSRRYLFHIVEALEKRGMPTELALLPMVESAMNPMAYSRAHASGLWQFIPSTGKQYNLQQNWWYDARRDIVASTNAALDYLQFLYEMHGDWHLALASYNWGENAVARAIERNKQKGLPTDFLSLSMPEETRYYVPKLQALKNIVANPQAFSVDLDPIPNAPYFATVTLTRDIDLKLAARLAEMPAQDLVALNPGHNRPVIQSSAASTLVLPADRLDRFLVNIGSYDKPLSNWRTYAAQRGERLDRIASAHGISVDKLRSVNGIRGAGRLNNDAQLIVPTQSLAADELPALVSGPATISAEPEARPSLYIAKKGDTWASLASRFKVTVADIQRWNRNRSLLSGQRVIVHADGQSPVEPTHPAQRMATLASSPLKVGVSAARNSQLDIKGTHATSKHSSRPIAKSSPTRKSANKFNLARH